MAFKAVQIARISPQGFQFMVGRQDGGMSFKAGMAEVTGGVLERSVATAAMIVPGRAPAPGVGNWIIAYGGRRAAKRRERKHQRRGDSEHGYYAHSQPNYTIPGSLIGCPKGLINK